MTTPPLPELPRPMLVFPCDECGRVFTRLGGHLMHNPCGQIRREGDLTEAIDLMVGAVAE